MAEWSKAADCKPVFRRFESGRMLQLLGTMDMVAMFDRETALPQGRKPWQVMDQKAASSRLAD